MIRKIKKKTLADACLPTTTHLYIWREQTVVRCTVSRLLVAITVTAIASPRKERRRIRYMFWNQAQAFSGEWTDNSSIYQNIQSMPWYYYLAICAQSVKVSRQTTYPRVWDLKHFRHCCCASYLHSRVSGSSGVSITFLNFYTDFCTFDALRLSADVRFLIFCAYCAIVGAGRLGMKETRV